MKSQDLSSSLSETAKTSQNTLTSTDLSQQPENCSQKNNGPKFACITRSCPNYAFLCQNQNCSCHILHQNCIITKTQKISKNLKSKVISIQPLEDLINQNVDKIIDYISLKKDKAISDLKSKFQFFGLTVWQKDVLKTLTKNDKLDVTGHQLWQIHQNLKLSQSIVQESFKNINKPFDFMRKQISDKYTEIEAYLNELLTATEINLTNQQDILRSAYNQCINQQSLIILSVNKQKNIFLNSKIVQTNELETVLNFFETKKISSAKLLYRASENGFLVSKFRENCEQFANTITFCLTQFGKKIGGFTCLDWRFGQKNHKKDEKGESFIFSITNKDKFKLINQQRAIYCGTSYGPDFGQDFCLRDEANSRPKSYSKICNDYYNSKYRKDDKDSRKSFSGGQTEQFKTAQWQVWHLQFE